MYECVLILFLFLLGVPCVVPCVLWMGRGLGREKKVGRIVYHILFHPVFCHVLIFCFGENETEDLRKLHWGVEEDCSVVLEC